MKKFLSALTAFCMGASMVASTLPASALTPLLSDAPKAQAGEFTWDIEDNVKPEETNGKRVAYIDVTVEGDLGTNAIAVGIKVEGKTFAEMKAENGLELKQIKQGDAYDRMSVWQANLDTGELAGANGTEDQSTQFAKDGGIVATYVVLVPDTVPDGVYDLEFYNVNIGNGNGTAMHDPVLGTGSLVIGDVEVPSESSSNTTKPTSNTTKPTTATTDKGDNTKPTVGSDEYAWDIADNVKPEEANGKRVAYIDVTVQNDAGTNAIAVGMLIEGKTFAEMKAENGLELKQIKQGDAYDRMSVWQANLDTGELAGANGTEDQSTQFGEGVVATYVVLVPDTVPDGVYDLTFYNVNIGSGDGQSMQNPVLGTGSLIIGDVTEPSDDEPTTPTTPTIPTSPDGFMWDIADDVKPEEANGKRVAYIDVTVHNDEGTNAIAVGMLIEGKTFAEMKEENGLELKQIKQGDAYDRMSVWQANLDTGELAGANGTEDQSTQYGKDGGVVATYVVLVPDTVPDGVYDLEFYNVNIGSGDGQSMLNPALGTGTLVIGDVEDPSDDPTEPKDEGFTWDIEDDVTCEEANGNRVAYIDVTVEKDPGTNAFTVGMLIEGKTFAEMKEENGLELKQIKQGDAYDRMSVFQTNLDTGEMAGANGTEDQSTQYGDGVVATYLVLVPDTVPDGVYQLTFYNVSIGSGDGKDVLDPILGTGSLIVGDVTPSEAPSDEFEPTTSEIDAEWIIGTVEAEPGETVTVPVTVKGDVDGINSYIADLGQDAGPKATGAEAGDAYAALDFAANIDTLAFGGTNYSLKENVVAKDGAVVFNMTFEVPADAEGTYDITFEDLELYNIDMVQLIPKKTDGWIKVTSPEPTESDSKFEPTSSEIDAEWIIGTVEAEAGETVTVPVTVKGDVDGINSYIANLAQDAGPKATDAAAGDAYAALDFAFNLGELEFGGTNYSVGENVIAKDGAVVFNVTFEVPADAAPGTLYNVKFEDLELYNIDMVQLIPKKTNGWIKIADDDDFVEESSVIDAEWIIGTVEAEAGETVTVPVTVKGDVDGINSYIADLGQDAGPKATDAAGGDAYAALDFAFNLENLTFGGTNYSVGENVIAKDGAVVFNVMFEVPADAAPGTIYDVVFEDLLLYDIDMVRLIPTKTDGWIKIKDIPETTTKKSETTTTESETTTTTETTTTATTKAAGKWIIGTVEADPGETVTVPVTVTGDLNGINSYILDMGQDEGPNAADAAAGDAYAALDFIFNLENLTFGATNYTVDENVIAKDGAVVFNVTFEVPADAAPGTIYDLVFEDLTVFDINMSELAPETQDGWIKIRDVEPTETTTTESETTTKKSETTTTESETTTKKSETTTTESETTTKKSETTTASETTTTSEFIDDPEETIGTDSSETEDIGSETTTKEPEVTTKAAGKWIIGTVEAEPGETVTVPVTVTGDLNGINSYIADLGQDAGPNAADAAAGDAYAALDFLFNLDNLTFGATNYTIDENVIAEDGAVVFNVTFEVPADAAPGTVYDIVFEDLTVYDINMSELTPEKQDGWIKIKDVEPTETTTTESETTTKASETTTTESETTTKASETTTTESETTTKASETTTTESETTTTESETTTTESETTTTESETTTTESETTTTESETTTTESETTTTASETTTTESETTTTASETTTTESETTTTESEPVPGAATWQIATVEAAAGETVTVDVTVTGDTGLNSYIFNMLVDEGPTALEAVEGDAYPTLNMVPDLTNALKLEFGATSGEVTNVVAADGAVVLTITFQVPADAKEGTIYNLTFDGDVEAINADMGVLDITEIAGWIKVLPADVTVTGYRYEVVGQHKFYLSHDMRPFDPADLVTSVKQYTLYSDGTESEGVEINVSEVKFDVPGWTNPEEVFKAQVLDENGKPKNDYNVYYTGAIPATIVDPSGEVQKIEGVGTAYIGVKGDATLTGEADAKDAAAILVFAATEGAGLEAYIYSETDAMLEDFAFFLADTTGESEDHGKTDSLGNETSRLDAKDAASVLVYAATVGAGLEADWAVILAEPLPKYTAAIDAYKKANAQ